MQSSSGGSATLAVDVLKSRGVPEERILFLNVIASPEGVTSFAQRFPKLRVVTAFVDQGLDENKWVPFLSSRLDIAIPALALPCNPFPCRHLSLPPFFAD